ncbi:hypothetical protein OnM2_022101 [Erysiphe neolycopersici]|uniref:SRR1-like domain-containing protein n=1 Tax=Erysiphe neolycopersici TaxID=212602 RepID=A0A420I2S6_9PEZI|nr:hypothetical protein OnM2_022101 [Erysiphe neolycopersici]
MMFTKRREVVDEEGWTHVIDRVQRAPEIKNKTPVSSSPSHTGDFEVNSIPYINRNLEEVKRDFFHWQKQWDESLACVELRKKIGARKEICNIKNIVVLGIGSLLSARREARRCSATQLAAVKTILQVLDDNSVPVVVQDPQYVKMDEEFLTYLGWTVVESPRAFEMISFNSLVFAVHCYRSLYCTIANGCRPAFLIGTKLENFDKLEFSQKPSAELNALKCMIEGFFDETDFPQMRNDFSDTKIYWRKVSTQ